MLKRLVTKHSDTFSKSDDDIGNTNLLKHPINAENASPVRLEDSARRTDDSAETQQ